MDDISESYLKWKDFKDPISNLKIACSHLAGKDEVSCFIIVKDFENEIERMLLHRPPMTFRECVRSKLIGKDWKNLREAQEKFSKASKECSKIF